MSASTSEVVSQWAAFGLQQGVPENETPERIRAIRYGVLFCAWLLGGLVALKVGGFAVVEWIVWVSPACSANPGSHKEAI